MDNELISIIVPIYNVEKYLERCLDSLIVQTYKNIEIILIDDGSTDGTGIICDRYAKQDSRIKVVHKTNAGVSSARNAGLKEVTGKYIGFVDPDDYISEDMYTVLYNTLIKTNSDISMCGYKCFFNNGINFNIKEENIEYTQIQALKKLMFDDEFTSHLWNKLYKRELFDEVIFPEGKIYEDTASIYKVIDKAQKITYNQSIQYAYFQRPESLCNNVSYKKINDYIEAIDDRYRYLSKKYPDYERLFYTSRVYSSLIFNYVAAKSKDKELYYSDILEEDYKRNIKFRFTFIKKIKPKYFLALMILVLNRNLFYKLFSK